MNHTEIADIFDYMEALGWKVWDNAKPPWVRVLQGIQSYQAAKDILYQMSLEERWQTKTPGLGVFQKTAFRYISANREYIPKPPGCSICSNTDNGAVNTSLGLVFVPCVRNPEPPPWRVVGTEGDDIRIFTVPCTCEAGEYYAQMTKGNQTHTQRFRTDAHEWLEQHEAEAYEYWANKINRLKANRCLTEADINRIKCAEPTLAAVLRDFASSLTAPPAETRKSDSDAHEPRGVGKPYRSLSVCLDGASQAVESYRMTPRSAADASQTQTPQTRRERSADEQARREITDASDFELWKAEQIKRLEESHHGEF